MTNTELSLILIAIIALMTLASMLAIEMENIPRLKQITQCEKELPSDQKCVLIAVPEEL